jgi:hypothetical protein
LLRGAEEVRAVRLFGGLGRRFGCLWSAYAVSAYGTGLGFGAFTYLAVRVLHAGPAQVSVLSAAGLAVGALVALPLGPWIEFRRKRPVMIAMDLVRFGALVSVPIAYGLGGLSLVQLIAVSVVASAANIAFTTASGAYLKGLVAPSDLLRAGARFESTTWSATIVGPTLGGAAIGLFGPTVTVPADAISFLLSAVGITAIGAGESRPVRAHNRLTVGDLVEGWRCTLRHPTLRALFLNRLFVNGLIMAGEPPLAVLMLGHLGFAAWQYGLAFAVPCVGGLIGSRLARPMVARYGETAVLLGFGRLRAVWPLALVLARPGVAGLVTVMAVELGLIFCCSVFNPVMATFRLRATEDQRLSRVLSAWSVSSSVSIAVLTVVWGLLASATGPRVAIGGAGLALLATPLLLRRVHFDGADLDLGPDGSRQRLTPVAVGE